MKQRILLAYSGSAESTSAIHTLVEQHRAEVVTLTVDVGQGGELQQIRDRALAAGAARAHVIDARDELARGYALPALDSDVPEGGWRRLIQALSLPLVDIKLREIAAIEKATIATDAPPHAVDANLLGHVVNDGRHLLTKPASAAPDVPAFVEIAFAGGVPVAINDVSLPLTELIESLSIIAGEHGVGRVEDVEAPAAVVLHAALQARVGPHGVARIKLFKGACEHILPELVTRL
jgi:argininosuccinate synthase